MNGDIWLKDHPLVINQFISQAAVAGLALHEDTLYQGPAQLIDNPDLALLNRHCVLLMTESQTLVRFAPEGVAMDPVAIQLPAMQPELAAQLFPRHPVNTLSPLRCLLSLDSVTCQLVQLSVMDELQKRQAWAWILSLHNRRLGKWQAVVLRERRGFASAYRTLSSFFAGMKLGPAVWQQKLKVHPLIPISPQCCRDNLTTYDAACQWLSTFMAAAQSNIGGICQDLDTEYLHQYRVNLRKARSVLSLLKGAFCAMDNASLKKELVRLMSLSGHLRDLDVYLQAEADYCQRMPTVLQAGVKDFFHYIRQQRAKSLTTVKQALEDKSTTASFSTVLTRLKEHRLSGGKFAASSIATFSAGSLLQHLDKTLNKAQIIQSDTPDEQVHELRIALKKLRYLTDLVAPVLARPAVFELAKSLKALTQQLGDFNDQCVQIVYLDSLAKNTDMSIEMAQAVGAMILICQQRQQQAREAMNPSLIHLVQLLEAPQLRQQLEMISSRRKQ